MEILILLLFAGLLVICVAADLPILYALCAGFVLFFLYSLHKGFTVRQTWKICLEGVLTVKNILLTFILIGMLTGLWRSAGTIPAIICYASGLITPGIFLLITFLLNCLVSFLTGTSFGTSATIGTVCMTMAIALQMNPVLVGGAIMSGIFFGDRCSPVSTSALLVSELTKTDIFDNIRLMVRTSIVPFAATCIIYLIAGLHLTSQGNASIDIKAVFSQAFSLGIIPLIPALLVLILAIFKVSVRKTLGISVASALLICLLYQHQSASDVLRILLTGYHASDAQLASMLDGGGLTSMIKVSCIVCLSSSYSGIFKATGLLDSLKNAISQGADRIGAFTVTLLASIVTSCISCNQTLAIILTDQLCSQTENDKGEFAIFLENSAVVIAPLVPWSIAGAVPLATIGAPTASLLAACYLYLIPLWYMLWSWGKRKQSK